MRADPGERHPRTSKIVRTNASIQIMFYPKVPSSWKDLPIKHKLHAACPNSTKYPGTPCSDPPRSCAEALLLPNSEIVACNSPFPLEYILADAGLVGGRCPPCLIFPWFASFSPVYYSPDDLPPDETHRSRQAAADRNTIDWSRSIVGSMKRGRTVERRQWTAPSNPFVVLG